MKTIKKNISKFNFSFKKKTTHIFIASSLSQKKLKYFRVVSYIRSNLKKITSLSQTYRKRNLKKFHYYLIGDLATNSLIGNGTNFAYEITKSLKQLENKIKVFDNNAFLNNFLPKSKTTQLSANFYLQSYNRLYKYWIPFNKKFTFLKKFIKKIFSVILPNSPIKIGYEIFSFFMIIFTLLFLPLHNIFWAHQNKNLFPLLLVVIFFFCELLMAFNTAYIKNGIIYNERKKIFLYSINVNTILDIFFLYFSIESFETNNEKEEFYYQELTHLIGTQMTNILIVYKVIRMSEILIYIEDYFLNLNERNSIIIRMTKLLAFNLICAHLISCSWISICFYDEGNQNSNCSAGLNFKRSNWFEIYIYGLYWAVTTMLTVGYGDITPTRNLELIFSILAMIFSCCLYGYTMNTVGVILKDYNNQENNLKYYIF